MSAEILALPSGDSRVEAEEPFTAKFMVVLDEPDLRRLAERADGLGISLEDMAGRIVRASLRLPGGGEVA